jgi:hypothetical protein
MIIDNEFLSDLEINNFRDLALFNPLNNWVMNPGTNRADPRGLYAIDIGNLLETPQMVSMIIPRDRHLSHVEHPSSDEFQRIFSKFLDKHQISCSKILRAKFNLIFRARNTDSDKHHMPHIDADVSHLVFLYYVNDSDGDTVFFKQKFNGSPVKNLDEEFRISPKAGTAVLFDGNQYHASSSPVDSEYRCILNVDFLSPTNISEL